MYKRTNNIIFSASYRKEESGMRIDAYNQIQQIYGTKQEQALRISFYSQRLLRMLPQQKRHSQQRLMCARIL